METIPYAQTTLEHMLGVPADRNPRIVRYTVALDNYEPVPRRTETGDLVEYDDNSETSGQPRYFRTLAGTSFAEQSVYIIDDGRVARPYYGGSFNLGKPSPLYPEGREPVELLYPFPVNPGGRRRPDNGREIDFTTWMLGPRKCYHLKIARG
jgi:hypothetical protein